MLSTLLSLIIILLISIISLLTQEMLNKQYPGSKNPPMKIFFLYLIPIVMIGALLYWLFNYLGAA